MTSSPDAASLQEQGCSELKLQATEVEVSGVKPRPELPPITLLTLLIWVYAVASVEFLMSLLFQDSFAKDGILVDNVDRLLFFLLLTGSRHFDY